MVINKEPARNKYVGHRYVPMIFGEWMQEQTYEGLSIVTYQGASYTSKKRVPAGIAIGNEEYWVVTGNYNAQIEQYRQDVKFVKDELTETIPLVSKSTDYLKDQPINARVDFNVQGDGTDETGKLQAALNASTGKTLYLPKPKTFYYIGAINIPSNTTLELADGIEIVGKSLAQNGFGKTTERLINILDVDNVVIKGNHSKIRLENKAQYTQEWNHIFNIQSANNVFIYDIAANDSGGDGFYIGDQESVKRTVPTNINLINCHADNNRRQGVSLVSVDGFYAERCTFTNTKGSAPETGIDIEPSLASQPIKNVKFVDCSATGNKSDGVRIHLQKMDATSQNVDITFVNFKSKQNSMGYALRDFAGVKGLITLENCISELNPFSGFVERGCLKDSVKKVYQQCKSINDNNNGVSNTAWQYANGSAFVFMAEKVDQSIGNSQLISCMVMDTRSPKKLNNAISCYSNPALTWISTDEVYVQDLKVDKDIRYFYEYTNTQNVNVGISERISEQRSIDVPSHTGAYRSVFPIDNNVILTNKGATAGIKHRLTKPTDKLIYRFQVVEPFAVVLDMFNFKTLNVPTGQHYSSNKPGSYVVIKGTGDGYYQIVEQVGEWTIVTL